MILAADLGTSSLKAGLLTHSGELVKRVKVSYKHRYPADSGWCDPLEWEEAFATALESLSGHRLTALSISGNGPTLVPCDMEGNALAPAELWLSERKVPSGSLRSWYLPGVLWLREHKPELWNRIRRLMICPQWLVFRLCGRQAAVIPHEQFRPWLWDRQQLTDCGLDPSLFGETVLMGDCIGTVSAEASARFGLPAGLPIAASGSDFICAMTGSGACTPGRVCDRAGTSEGLNYCTTRPVSDSRLLSLPHAVEGLWNCAAMLTSTGTVFEWYRHLTGQSDRSYDQTMADIESVPAGRRAPLFFPGARGRTLWEFQRGRLEELEPRHRKADIGRAVMEAIGYAVRRGIDLLEENGLPVDSMIVTGGQARSRVWNQMKADITGRPLHIPVIEDAELTGCALNALCALGLRKGIADVLQDPSLVRIREQIEPRQAVHSLYNEAYAHYRSLAEQRL